MTIFVDVTGLVGENIFTEGKAMHKGRIFKKQNRVALAKRSVLGRVLCRLCGDTAGGVMMEYVILGVLVAAAVVALVWAFGGTLAGGMRNMISTIFNPQTSGDTFTTEKTESGSKATTAAGQTEQFNQ